MPDTTAYPLSWPLGYPRAARRESSLFTTSFAGARDGLLEELRLMGAGGVVLSSNVPLRRDGLPYANFPALADAGVAVYFTWRQQPYVLACDRWAAPQDNLQAIRKTVEALHGIARWGASEMLAAAFAGFKALPQQASTTTERAWWQVLGVEHNASAEAINAAYRQLAKQGHPDAGGSHERMAELNAARAQGLK